MAVHEISPVSDPPAEYTRPHVHDDCNEINIILSSEKLVYKILFGTKEHIIGNNISVVDTGGNGTCCKCAAWFGILYYYTLKMKLFFLSAL